MSFSVRKKSNLQVYGMVQMPLTHYLLSKYPRRCKYHNDDVDFESLEDNDYLCYNFMQSPLT